MDLETIKTTAMWAIVIVAGLGLLLAIVIKKIIGKVLSLLIAATLVFVFWQQRDKVINYADQVRGQACEAASAAVDNATTQRATTFLGIGVSLPDGWCS